MRIYFKKTWLLGNAVQKSQKQEESKLEYFKRLVKQHLDELETKADGEKEGVKKAILAAENMAKGGMPVGTIREWKGKKYIKVAPGKWRPKYDGNTRGAKLSIAALKRKADKCGSSEELLHLILENRDRFSDESGRPLPFVKELSDHVSALNERLEAGKTTKTAAQEPKIDYKKLQEDFKKELASGKRSNTKELKEDVSEWKNLIASGGYKGEHLNHLKEVVKIGEAELKRREKKNPPLPKKVRFDGKDWKIKELGDGKFELTSPNGDTGLIDTMVGTREQVQKVIEVGERQEKNLDKIKSILDRNIEPMPEEIKFTKKNFEKLFENGIDSPIEHIKIGENQFQKLKEKGRQGLLAPMADVLKNPALVIKTKDDAKLYVKTYKGEKNTKNVVSVVVDKGDVHVSISTHIERDSQLAKKMDSILFERTESVHGITPHEEQKPQLDSSIPQTDKKSSGSADIRRKYESSKSVTGNKKTVTLPDGTKIKCHYKIVEADAPTASHDERTFAPTKGFPTNDRGQNINDRDYQNDADAQESVRKIAANFNALALESPPIVTKDGIVISGNNRTMSSKLAAKNGTDKAYLSDLKEMIDEYGLDEEDLDGFRNPRLVLETDAEHEGEYTTEEFAQFNRDTKKTMSNVEKAVRLTKTLNERKIQSIAEELSNYDTMGELYADAKGCQKFVGKLIEAGIIGENEKAQYCRSDGTLNDTGKDFCETVLVGSVLDEWNIRKLDGAGGKRIRQKLVRAILPLIENKGNGREYSFNKELNEAVGIAVNVAKNHDTYPTVDVYLAQGTLFGERKPDEITGKLATLIHDEGEKAFAARMKDLGAGLKSSSNGEMDIFLGGIESKQSLMERFLDIKKSVSSILSKFARKDRSVKEMVSDVLNKIA